MSRSGYTDDYDEDGTGGLWRGAVRSAINGKRGQAVLREIASAMDAMPEKALAAESLVTAEGEFCTLGVLGAARGVDLARLDPDDSDQVAAAFGIAPALAREIVYMNDEYGDDDYQWVKVEICGPIRPYHPEYGSHWRERNVATSDGAERRWNRMRKWVAENLKAST
jgi:hypothetical protein